MSDLKSIKELALYAAKKQVPAEFSNKSVEDVNDALRAELKELCGDYNLYRRNKLDLFEIIQETMDEVVPKEVEGIIAQFADVRTYPNGTKPQFKLKKGKSRAKKFATAATASGVYETFRLDSDVVEVPISAIGDAAYIDFERFLSGDEDWADYMEALTEGILHETFKRIRLALEAARSTLANYNQYTDMTLGYNANALQDAISTVRAYGSPVLVATEGFAQAMGPDLMGTTTIAPTDDIESIHRYGYVQMFRGTPVIVLPRSFENDDNTGELFGGEYAYIFPTDGDKVVKVAFEGNTIVKDWENRDNSMEIQAYKKMGAVVVTYNNWGYVYKS